MASKRRASNGSAGAPNKRAATEITLVATNVAKCGVVTAALLDADLPEDVRQLLASSAVTSLGENTNGRHAWQAEMVDWIGTALAGTETSLTQRVSDCAAEIQRIAVEIGSKEANIRDVDATGAAMKEALAEAEAKKEACAVASQTAETALFEAANTAAVGETELFELVCKISELQSLTAEGSTYAKSQSEQLSRAATDDFAALLVKHNFEAGLVQTVPLVLVRPPAERTGFTAMVLQQFETSVEKRLAGLNETQLLAASAQTQRVAEAAAAEEVVKSACVDLEVATGVVREARAAAKHSDVVAKETNKALKELTVALKEAQAAEQVAVLASEAFQQGPLASFLQLKEHSAPTTEGLRGNCSHAAMEVEEQVQPNQDEQRELAAPEKLPVQTEQLKVLTDTSLLADPMMSMVAGA